MKLLRELLFPLIAVVAAFIVGGIVVLLIGDDPFETYRLLIGSALSWPDGIGYTLFYATPLIFTGLAVAVAFRCGLLNIGAEGQLYVAAFATAWVGITFANLSGWILIPLAFLAAMLSGAVWGAIPGVLKAKFGSHEVINTIMLNFVAVALTSYFTQYYFKTAGDPILQTVPIGRPAAAGQEALQGANAHIPRLGEFIPGLPERIPLNVAFILALVACILVYLFLWRTKWGYEIRATGSNPTAAEYGGISTGRQIVLAMAVSGALAGMVGINEVLGYRYRFYSGFSPGIGYGFTGITVALLGRNHPVGVLLAALLFGALTRGSLFVDIFTERVSKDLVLVLQGVVILFVASEALFRGSFRRFGLMRRSKI
ncbi:MAG TPA: ABC transporter permease [Pyrinomonadaceae bacterium]|jgi:simple sugar transport system permease protein|nr:ABC transporter permease [Pyrinomonadaceae bacterium]